MIIQDLHFRLQSLEFNEALGFRGVGGEVLGSREYGSGLGIGLKKVFPLSENSRLGPFLSF